MGSKKIRVKRDFRRPGEDSRRAGIRDREIEIGGRKNAAQ